MKDTFGNANRPYYDLLKRGIAYINRKSPSASIREKTLVFLKVMYSLKPEGAPTRG